MQHWIDAYLADAASSRRLSPRTVALYAQSLGLLEQHCAAEKSNDVQPPVSLLAVERRHIRSWLAKRHQAGTAPSTLATELTAWRGFYQWLALQGHISDNPCLDVRAPKSPKPLPKALGVDAAMALANCAATPHAHSASNPTLAPNPAARHFQQLRDSLIVELLYGCGLRVSELVGLDTVASTEAMRAGLGWIDLASTEVHVLGKGNKRRTVPLGRQAALALTAYLDARSEFLQRLEQAERNLALLLSPKGARLSRQAVWAVLQNRSLAAGLDTPVHPHMLRHSFASHVLQSSGDLRAVQELLGHSSIASTQVYTQLDFQHLANIYDSAHPRAKLSKTVKQ